MDNFKTADELAYRRCLNGQHSYRDYLDVRENEGCEPQGMVDKFKVIACTSAYPYAVVFTDKPTLCVKLCDTPDEAVAVKGEYELGYSL